VFTGVFGYPVRSICFIVWKNSSTDCANILRPTLVILLFPPMIFFLCSSYSISSRQLAPALSDDIW